MHAIEGFITDKTPSYSHKFKLFKKPIGFIINTLKGVLGFEVFEIKRVPLIGFPSLHVK